MKIASPLLSLLLLLLVLLNLTSLEFGYISSHWGTPNPAKHANFRLETPSFEDASGVADDGIPTNLAPKPNKMLRESWVTQRGLAPGEILAQRHGHVAIGSPRCPPESGSWFEILDSFGYGILVMHTVLPPLLYH